MKYAVFTIFIFSAMLLSGCASTAEPVKWYQYEGDSDFDRAKSKCDTEATIQYAQINCAVACITPVCSGGFACGMAKGQASVNCGICRGEKNSVYKGVFDACMSELGFLRCSQGGQALPECQ